MKGCCRWLLCLFLLLPCLVADAQSDFEKMILNIATEEVRGVSITWAANSASTWGNLMNAGGQFSDIDYAHTAANDASFADHLGRLRVMAIAYTRNGSTLFNSDTLYTKILSGLGYWNANINNAGNWYYNQIAYPKNLGQLLCLMRAGTMLTPSTLAVPTVDEGKAIAYLRSRADPYTQTGANRTDEGMHWMYRGALTDSATVVNKGLAAIFSTLEFSDSSKEGLNRDNAFLQHGPQYQTQSYGDDWTVGLYYTAACTAGTSAAITKWTTGQKDMLFHFYHDAFLGAVRGRYNDFNAIGRSISRKGKTGVTAITIARAMKVDPDHYADLKNDSLRIYGVQPAGYGITPAHIHFWNGDLTLHNRPGYSFSVRMNSTRTERTEYGNGENLKGEFLADGATSIRLLGPEYADMYAVWDWNKIPGVTMRENASPANTALWGKPGTSTFVGGVSDSVYGASTYHLSYAGIWGRKSWFFFDDEVVCLGAGINANVAGEITTAVNQTLLKMGTDSTVSIKNNGTVSLLPDNTTSTYTGTLSWALHNKTGYFFPAGGTVNISNQVQTGNWYTINSGQPNATVSAKVFRLSLNHGSIPGGAGYAYIVAPGMSGAAAMDAYDLNKIKVISNTSSVQAVKHQGLKMLQAIFNTAGTVVDSASHLKITVSDPCALMIKNTDSSKITIHVADPTQTLSFINVTVQFSYSGPEYYSNVALPTGDYKGASVRIVMDSTQLPPQNGAVVADTYVRNGIYANDNYGGAGNLVVKNDAADYARQTYLKFDLHGLKRPVSNARLQLYSTGGGAAAGTTKWVVSKVPAGSWSDSTLTWNNRPLTAVPVDSVTGQTAAGYIGWDVTAALNALHIDSTLALQVVSTALGNTTDVSFASRETPDPAKHPVLIIDDTPPVADSVVAVADTYVRDGGNANDNFGTQTTLIVKKDVAGYTRETYLKFNLDSIPLGIISASLRLYGTGNTTANTTSWQLYNVMDSSWTEYGLTWNNKPAADTLLAVVNGKTGSGFSEWNITDLVRKRAGSGILSLKLVSTVSGPTTDGSFGSREAAQPGQRPYIIFYTKRIQ